MRNSVVTSLISQTRLFAKDKNEPQITRRGIFSPIKGANATDPNHPVVFHGGVLSVPSLPSLSLLLTAANVGAVGIKRRCQSWCIVAMICGVSLLVNDIVTRRCRQQSNSSG